MVLVYGHSLKNWILFAFWDFLFFVMTLWVFALMVEEFYMHLRHERCIEGKIAYCILNYLLYC
jgi:hypothetical protein